MGTSLAHSAHLFKKDELMKRSANSAGSWLKIDEWPDSDDPGRSHRPIRATLGHPVQAPPQGLAGSPVGTPDLHVLNGTARQLHGADVVVLVTNGRFTTGCPPLAKSQKLHLVDRNLLGRGPPADGHCGIVSELCHHHGARQRCRNRVIDDPRWMKWRGAAPMSGRGLFVDGRGITVCD